MGFSVCCEWVEGWFTPLLDVPLGQSVNTTKSKLMLGFWCFMLIDIFMIHIFKLPQRFLIWVDKPHLRGVVYWAWIHVADCHAGNQDLIWNILGCGKLYRIIFLLSYCRLDILHEYAILHVSDITYLNGRTNMNKAQVTALMQSSKSEEWWDTNTNKVIKACGGYPNFWYDLIIQSGLYARVSAGWDSDD